MDQNNLIIRKLEKPENNEIEILAVVDEEPPVEEQLKTLQQLCEQKGNFKFEPPKPKKKGRKPVAKPKRDNRYQNMKISKVRYAELIETEQKYKDLINSL